MLWKVWEDFKSEMKCDAPFNPLELLFSNQQIASLLEPVRQVQLPANLPPQLAQQAFNQILQQIQIVTINPIDYELFHAAVKSVAVLKVSLKLSGKSMRLDFLI